MFQRFTNPTVIYARRIQHGLEEARMAALEHESAAEHHDALAKMYRERVRRLQAELAAINTENRQVPPDSQAQAEQAAAQVHRINPRGNGAVGSNSSSSNNGNGNGNNKREDSANNSSGSLQSGFLPQGAAG